jgi:hypothetical protein
MLEFYNLMLTGGSSFLFIFSALHALIISDLIAWKIFNILIIISSFLYNTCDWIPYRNFDYIIISALSMSYINNSNINMLFGLCFFIEIILKQQITITKNIVCLLTFILVLFNTLYIKPYLSYIFILVTIIGILVYYYRNILYYSTGCTLHAYFFLTTLWHLCAMIGLCISSYSTII